MSKSHVFTEPTGPRAARRFLARSAIAACALGVCAPRARAADESSTCVAAYEHSQVLRREHKLARARDELRTCARATCPGIARNDCITWLDQVQSAFPSIAIRAQKDGSDTAAVKVTEDNEVIATRLDGSSIEVEPGEHAFRFETDGAPAVTLTIVVREKEKDRTVPVVFTSPHREHAGATAGGGAGPARPVPGGVYALAGVGVAGLATFAVLGAVGNGNESSLRRSCSPDCSAASIDRVRTELIAADVGLGVGAVSLATAVILVPGAAGQERRSTRSPERPHGVPTPRRGRVRLERKVLRSRAEAMMQGKTRLAFVLVSLGFGMGLAHCAVDGLNSLGAGSPDSGATGDAAAAKALDSSFDSPAEGSPPTSDASTPSEGAGGETSADATSQDTSSDAEAPPPAALPIYLDAGTAGWCQQHPGYAFCADFDETPLPAGFGTSNGSYLVQTSSLPSSGPNDLLVLVPAQSGTGTWGSTVSRAFATNVSSITLSFDFYPEILSQGGMLFAAIDFQGNPSAKYSVRLAYDQGLPRLEESYLGSPPDVYHSNFTVATQTYSRVEMQLSFPASTEGGIGADAGAAMESVYVNGVLQGTPEMLTPPRGGPRSRIS